MDEHRQKTAGQCDRTRTRSGIGVGLSAPAAGGTLGPSRPSSGRRHRHRHATVERCLAAGDLTLPRLDDVAEQDFVDLVSADAGSLEGSGNGETAEIHCGE